MKIKCSLAMVKPASSKPSSATRRPPGGTSVAIICLLCWILIQFFGQEVLAGLMESERVEEYRKRNYTWPVTHYVPDTEGWKRLCQSRLAQVAEIEDRDQRYEGFLQAVYSAYVAPNFTAHGFGLARAPDDLLAELQRGVRDGLPTARRERTIEVIDAPAPPLFVDRPDLTRRVLRELRGYAEAWSGISVTPHRAYGFRLYRNDSTLYMHVDRPHTHVISFILHIDSSDDAEPWPIFIDDFHGRLHEVVLTPGDMLFYESSKCFHGRPRRFRGSWYSSVFVHYYPANVGWERRDHKLEAHYAVPPEWSRTPPREKTQPRLDMVGTSFTEPDCPDGCCRCQRSIQWRSGPGEENVWIDPTGSRHPFHPRGDDTRSSSDEL